MVDAPARLSLQADASAPSHARRFVELVLGGVEETVVYDVTLAVSELVTNAVRHGAGPAYLEVTTAPDHVRVAVFDSGAVFSRSGAPTPSNDATSGRGLVIVAALAHDWGIESEVSGGKSVWFTIGTS